jgi:hypothetical protein
VCDWTLSDRDAAAQPTTMSCLDGCLLNVAAYLFHHTTTPPHHLSNVAEADGD